MEKFLKFVRDRQLELQKRINLGGTVTAYKLMTSSYDKDREQMSSWNILAMHAELSELLEWTNWKIHKKTRVEYDANRIREIHIELIDILHYWMNLCIIWGLTPEKIVRMYEEKNDENHKRQDRGY